MSALTDELLTQIKLAGLPEPEAEIKFHPSRKWRFDFGWRRRRLAVEVEGGTWIYGRHNRPQSFEKDCEKYSEAAIEGWRLIRVTGNMIRDGRALDLVTRAVGRA